LIIGSISLLRQVSEIKFVLLLLDLDIRAKKTTQTWVAFEK
jgi:hypothetical protein